MVPEPLLENYRREWVIDDYPYGHTEYCRCESCRVARQHRNTYANLNRDYFIPLREKKEDFLPKKKIKYHTLEEPIEYDYEAEEAAPPDEDGGCGCDTVCNCYDVF